MDAYTDFAAVYDTFMDETPYDVWGNFVAGLIEEFGVSKPYPLSAEEQPSEPGGKLAESGEKSTTSGEQPSASEGDELEAALDEERNLVVELGCGTGSFTMELKKKGYDIMGIDLSPEMLDLARKKSSEAGLEIMYLEQDMRELDLYCTAGTIVSVCDSINYILEDEEVIETFRLVNNFLFPGGVFIFDFNTVHKYRDVIGDTTIAENREDCSFIWDNYYHEEDHVNEYDLTIFAKCEDDGVEDGGLFRRSVETHYQRGYTLEEMRAFIEKAGLKFAAAIDADTHDAPSEESERIYIVARECGK